MIKKKAEQKDAAIHVGEIDIGALHVTIIGTTPLVYNAMSFKAQQSLIKPAKKTTAEKATTLKHEPWEEFRNSIYARPDEENGATRLLLPCRMFKAAMCEVALRIPGATKTALKQLVWVEGEYCDVYGVPQIFSHVVRSADINRTPDIRTQAIVPFWTTSLEIRYVQPHLSAQTLAKLLGHAGILCGVGDFRQQKGAGNYGQFEVCPEDHPKAKSLRKTAGMRAQDQALDDPDYWDKETERLLEWFDAELRKTDKPRRSSEARE